MHYAACDLAPVLQVNYEFHGPLTGDTAVDVIERYPHGELVARTISGTVVKSASPGGAGGAG